MFVSIRSVPFLLLALVTTGALARASQDDELRRFNEKSREIQQRLREAGEQGNELSELMLLRRMRVELAEEGDLVRQVLSLFTMNRTTELGNYAEALVLGDEDGGRPRPGRSADTMAEAEPLDALEVLPAMTEGVPIVMINEAHHVPQHRAFSIQLLRALRPLGFTHFAAETLFEGDTELNERGYPTKATGAYIAEPLYADLVRIALELGYVVVPYEAAHGAPDRELGQATNLITRILDEEPDARVLVHAGYAHIEETGVIAGARTMCEQLKEITGIDPLTIDQTAMSEHSAPEREHPVYRHVTEYPLPAPTVFVEPDGRAWSLDPEKWDVSLFHPRTVYERGRPTWLAMGELRRPFALPPEPFESLENGKHYLVRARAADEPAEAIPLDRIEVVGGRPVPALYLPAGEFVLEIEDADGTRVHEERIRQP